MITGGVVAHPLPRALDVLRFFRDTCAPLPDEMMLVAGPADRAGWIERQAGRASSAATAVRSTQGEAAVRPLKAFGPPVMDALGPMPYCALNSMLDPAFPKGRAQLLESAVPDRPERRCDSDADREVFEECPSPMSHIIIEHFHGAASRVPVANTACAMRVTGFNVVIISQWMSAERDRARDRLGTRHLLRRSRRTWRRRVT